MSKKEPNQNYVLNNRKSEVLAFSETLAKRPDMTPFHGTLTAAKKEAKRLSEESNGVMRAIPIETPPEAKEEEAPPDRIEYLAAAISKLDPDNPEQYTAMGVPRTGAIEATIGDDVTAEERDEAFALYKKNKGE